MAEKRMFAKSIIDSDAFLDLPLISQVLYFHLSMRADDDGFVNSPKKIQRMIGASDDDMKLLFAKGFVIPFESGVCVIKHWRIHNYIQNDRYHETIYASEKSQLILDKNKEYMLSDTACIQSVSEMEAQIREDKIREDKTSIERDNKRKSAARFSPPSREEVEKYCLEAAISIDIDHFIDYYTANGWRVGSKPMKDWKASVRNWKRRDSEFGCSSAKQNPPSPPVYTDSGFFDGLDDE